MKIAIMGYGTIGSGVAAVLEKNRDSIARKTGEPVELKYVLDLREFPGDPIEKKLVHDVDVIMNDPEVGIVVETMGGVDFEASEFLPVAVMIFVTVFMNDYVAGIALGMFVYLILTVLRHFISKECDLPEWPAWALGVLMILYFVF